MCGQTEADRATLKPQMEHVIGAEVRERAAGSFVACRLSLCLRCVSAAAPPHEGAAIASRSQVFAVVSS